MSGKRLAVRTIIQLAIDDSDDSNEAVATLLSCAYSILVTAGNSEPEALSGLHDIIDELSAAYTVRTARLGVGTPS